MSTATKSQKLLLSDIANARAARLQACSCEGPTLDVCLRNGWIERSGIYVTITGAGRAALEPAAPKPVKPGRHPALCRCIGCTEMRIRAGLGAL